MKRGEEFPTLRKDLTPDFETSRLTGIENVAWRWLNVGGLTRAKLLEEAFRLSGEKMAPRNEEYYVLKAVESLTRDGTKSRLWYASQWLKMIYVIRRYRREEPEVAFEMTLHLGASYREAGLRFGKISFETLAMSGLMFDISRRKPRMDALSKLLRKMLPGTNKEVLNNLKVGGIIDHVDYNAGIVYWCVRNGNAKESSFKSIANRLSKLRTKYPHKKLRK